MKVKASIEGVSFKESGRMARKKMHHYSKKSPERGKKKIFWGLLRVWPTIQFKMGLGRRIGLNMCEGSRTGGGGGGARAAPGAVRPLTWGKYYPPGKRYRRKKMKTGADHIRKG